MSFCLPCEFIRQSCLLNPLVLFAASSSLVCFSLISILVRVVYSVDPVSVHQFYPVAAINFLITLSVPFAFITTTLIAIYWSLFLLIS